MRIVLADDHEIVRKGIRDIISAEPSWEVCGEAADGQQAIELVMLLKPDLVVLDLSMPVLNGLQAASQIRHSAPRTKILILSMHDSSQSKKAALDVGADAFLTKTVSVAELVRTLAELLNSSHNSSKPQR
jgi:DNA-binding NarL/FixJ family response regulator